MNELYIGLMSGTSADGIDAALVDFSHAEPNLIATHYVPYPSDLREKILGLFQPGENEIERMGEIDTRLGKEFAQAVLALLKKQTLNPVHVKAIGSHGQTVRHLPNDPYRFTLQIGNPNIIAAETGITTVADFRRKDLAFGGQGAPLVPAFHQALFAHGANRAIVNIGGIANITLLTQDMPEHIRGYDTGPGNVLMDLWMHVQHKKNHDADGAWAKQGHLCQELLALMLSDPYFHLPAPKSTGREYFNLAWLEKNLAQLKNKISSVDVQATLAELTAQTIFDAVQKQMSRGEIIVCGGGAHNKFLMQRLQQLAQPNFSVDSTEKHAIAPDWVEAVAFAWLAKQTMSKQPGNVPGVTGASKAAVLGGVYFP